MSLSAPDTLLRRSPFSWRPSTRLLWLAALAAGLVALPVLSLGFTNALYADVDGTPGFTR